MLIIKKIIATFYLHCGYAKFPMEKLFSKRISIEMKDFNDRIRKVVKKDNM